MTHCVADALILDKVSNRGPIFIGTVCCPFTYRLGRKHSKQRRVEMFEHFFKVIVAIASFILIGLLMYLVIHSSMNKSLQKCPPCKCECKCKNKLPHIQKKISKIKLKKKLRKKKNPIQQNADTLYLFWLEQCKKKSKHALANLLACVRWIKLREYLKVDYADQTMIMRRETAHLIFDRLGRSLCFGKTGNVMHDSYVTKELSSVYSNARENIRRLKNIKRRVPTLTIPSMKMCILKDGSLTWNFP